MDCIVVITKVEFLEINQMFESELKLYFSFDNCECYTLMPGSKKELCRMFNLDQDNTDECHFESIVGRKCRVSKTEDSYAFIECL